MEEYRMIGKSDISGFLVSFIKFIRNSIRFTILSIRKYALSSVVVFALVVAAGVYYATTKPSYYESDMVCVYNHLHKKTYGEMIRKLNTLAQTGSYTTLGQMLNMPVEKVKAVVSLEAQNIAGAPLYEDISQGKFPFYIVVKATNAAVYNDLQPALLKYMNSAPYQVLRNKLETKRLTQKIQYTGHSIQQIDSIVSAYPLLLKENANELDTASNVSNMIGLISYRDKLVSTMLTDESTMQSMISVELLHGFAPSEHPVQPKKTKNILSFIILAAVLAGMWAVLKNLMSHVSEA